MAVSALAATDPIRAVGRTRREHVAPERHDGMPLLPAPRHALAPLPHLAHDALKAASPRAHILVDLPARPLRTHTVEHQHARRRRRARARRERQQRAAHADHACHRVRASELARERAALREAEEVDAVSAPSAVAREVREDGCQESERAGGIRAREEVAERVEGLVPLERVLVQEGHAVGFEIELEIEMR